MLNKLFTFKALDNLATEYGCSNIYGISFVFVPGYKNHVGNIYVLFFFDFRSYHVTFLLLGHKPRVGDVEALIKKLGPVEDALLVSASCSPFAKKDIKDLLNTHFTEYQMFNNRPRFGIMFLFEQFLLTVLYFSMKAFKKEADDQRDEDSPVFIYHEDYVKKIVGAWEDKFEESLEVVFCRHPEMRFIQEVDKLELYNFQVDVQKNTEHECLLHLFPNTKCSVDNKLLQSIFYVLNNQEEVKSISPPKIVLINVLADDSWYTLRKSLMFDNTMKLEEFLDEFKSSIFSLKNRAYPFENIDYVALAIVKGKTSSSSERVTTSSSNQITISSGVRTFSTFRGKSINPLQSKKNATKNLGVLDIETVVVDGVHIPYAIGYQLLGHKSHVYYASDFGKNLYSSKDKIMSAFMKDLLLAAKGHYIYCHNLGAFDGYLLLKDLNKVCENINILMDSQKKFISIDIVDTKTNFRDSLRILPTNLDSLSKLFKVPIKKGHLSHENVTKDIIFTQDFKIEAIEYLNKDLASLLDVVTIARKHLLFEYQIDFSQCYSASSMAMKIYRTKFMKNSIQLLPTHVDKFVRDLYRGGSTEVYKCRGDNLYYYDVNSLYPAAMLNKMPCEFLRKSDKVDLTDFFGFIDADIYAPQTIFNPFLPYKDYKTGNLLYPHGRFSGIFFSEELKLAASKGYIITPKTGYEFSSSVMFADYVNYFYDKKLNSEGGERFLYKLILNSIYGYLGRKPETLKTEIVSKLKFMELLTEYEIHSYTELDDEKYLVTHDSLPSRKVQMAHNIKPSFNPESVKMINNVAIASAITSYARMLIVPVKTNPDNPPLYTDTDSVFLPNPLPKNQRVL